jgi:hypothetical protein
MKSGNDLPVAGLRLSAPPLAIIGIRGERPAYG